MTDERYADLMASIGMPNSRSLLGVLQQVANEVGQEKNEQIAALKAEIKRLGDAQVLALFEGAETAEAEAPVAAKPQQLHVSEMSTRELLKAQRRSYRGAAFGYETHETPEPTFVGKRWLPGNVLGTCHATQSEIRTELATREHIPSKKESKILRQLGAKKKQKKEQVKASAIGAGMLFEVQHPARIQICATQKQFIAFYKAALGKKLFAAKYKIVK